MKGRFRIEWNRGTCCEYYRALTKDEVVNRSVQENTAAIRNVAPNSSWRPDMAFAFSMFWGSVVGTGGIAHCNFSLFLNQFFELARHRRRHLGRCPPRPRHLPRRSRRPKS